MSKISRLTLTIAVAIALLLPACGAETAGSDSGEMKGTLTISGAFALYPMMTRWAEEYQRLNPGVQFDISAGGAGKGMTDALSGAVDIGMVSRDVTAEEEAQGAYWVPVTKDAVFPVVNAQNPVLVDLMKIGLSQDVFEGIFITGEIKTWGQAIGKPEITDEIHVYTRSDACGAAETWAKYLGGKQENLLGIGVFGDPGLLDAVIKDPQGIGFNNLNYAYDMASGAAVTGAAILPIDVNGNSQIDPDETLTTKDEAVAAVANGRYPSPPARVENLVTNGKPEGLVQAFIQWILTGGQQYLEEAGYIPLPPDQVDASLLKVQ
ncbi:MAG: substrate-binding domain-containing protein [Anaerolineales bacterium]|nr:substrate-binding domain-containing protein [Anaerolineales bacterium]